MMSNSFRDRLLHGETLIGTVVTLPTFQVPEILTLAGFDWLFIDSEHAPLGVADVAGLVQAGGKGAACIVRVPDHADRSIKNALDSGADGIIAPMVNTASQAETIVASCKYPPMGRRGLASTRAHGYGASFQEYLHRANEDITVIIQAEHVEAVKNIESITSVPGVDCVLVGPYDLSGSMGLLGQVKHPEIQGAILHVLSVCQEKHIPLGIFSPDPALLAEYHRQGFTLLALGQDSSFLMDAAKSSRQKLLDGIRQ